MTAAISVAWMFPIAFGLILLGLPVAFCLLVVAFAFGLSLFDGDLALIGLQMHDRLMGVSSNYVLAAIPLFILMGAILERCGLAERLFQAVRLWLGRLPAGLAVTTLVMCALLAAASGVVGAVEVLVGMMALPAMSRAGYRGDLAAGTVCAGGSLGTIIPPSILVVVYASATRVSVGDMLAGVLIPGVLMVSLFAGYMVLRGWLRPEHAPVVPPEEVDMPLARKLRISLLAFLPTVGLIVTVLGTIFAGVASPTEAGALGVVGALVLAVVYRDLTGRALLEALRQAMMITGMIMVIVFAGIAFTSVFMIGRGGELVEGLVAALDLGPAGMVALFLAILFVLGFFLDWVSVILIAIPIFDPLVRASGVDPVWFGVMVCVVLQTSYLTPPMAPSIFYLRAIAPPEMSYGEMCRGVAPFVLIQLFVLAIVAAAPSTATWLPTILFTL